jgi:hypothetical protein
LEKWVVFVVMPFTQILARAQRKLPSEIIGNGGNIGEKYSENWGIRFYKCSRRFFRIVLCKRATTSTFRRTSVTTIVKTIEIAIIASWLTMEESKFSPNFPK